MTRFRVSCLVVSLLLVFVVGGGETRASEFTYAKGDMTLGRKNAPVTVIEYASMTCPHCARFHLGPFKKLKSKYIDTGKVRFIFREFPFDPLALQASMLARCTGETRYFGMLKVLFKNLYQVFLVSQLIMSLLQPGVKLIHRHKIASLLFVGHQVFKQG